MLDLGWKTYAFVGLERTTQSAVAVFDVSTPWGVRFLDMIVTERALAPEASRSTSTAGSSTSPSRTTALPGETARTTAVYEIGFALSR